MADKINPIKRSPQLAPLSRTHHDVLLFVWKIRQGIKMEVHPERIVAYVHWYWQHRLQPLLLQEEKVLLPFMNDHPQLVMQLQQEHTLINDSIEVVLHNSYWETLENLAHTVMDHIRFEERVFLAQVEKSASAADLELMGAQFAESITSDVWEDTFWEYK